MIFVPGGIFRMGCDEDNRRESCQPDEAPLHSVSLSDYRIDRTEVTTAQYAACVAAGACNPPLTSSSITRPNYYNNPDFASYPVINVTWQDAAAYCLWAGKRLPSEAEWEKAARLSKLAPIYPWGDKAPTCELANYQSPEGPCIGDTAPVDSYPQGLSPVGAADLAGNVAEWVNDWYLAGYYFASPASNPTGPRSSDLRVVRGGSWNSDWEDIRTARRNSLFSNVASLEIGFRCAWTP
jgi:serine/threonine-protein kinase